MVPGRSPRPPGRVTPGSSRDEPGASGTRMGRTGEQRHHRTAADPAGTLTWRTPPGQGERRTTRAAPAARSVRRPLASAGPGCDPACRPEWARPGARGTVPPHHRGRFEGPPQPPRPLLRPTVRAAATGGDGVGAGRGTPGSSRDRHSRGCPGLGYPGGFASAYRTLSMMEERGRVQRGSHSGGIGRLPVRPAGSGGSDPRGGARALCCTSAGCSPGRGGPGESIRGGPGVACESVVG